MKLGEFIKICKNRQKKQHKIPKKENKKDDGVIDADYEEVKD